MSSLDELRARHMADALAMAPGLIERLDWDAVRLAAHRTEALRVLVRVAVGRSPWHRKRLAAVGTDSLDLAGLPGLPVMTKADVMANFDDVVTDDRLRLADVEAYLEAAADGGYLLDRYTAVASGGSAGGRGVFVYDWDGWATYWVSSFRRLLQDRAVDPALAGRPVVVTWVAAAHPSHVSAAMARTFNDPNFVNVRLPVTLPIEQIVAGLNQARPQVLAAYPSALQLLAAEATAGRLRIAPLRVISGGEPLLPEIRAAIGTAWPVPLTNWWASTEVGCSILPCAHGRSHLADDLAIVEAVDAQGRPTAPGERSAKVYVTNLFNHAMPLIRYEITDEITVLAEPCPCASPTPCVADVQGRMDDTFDYGGRKVHPHVFRSALGRRAGIVEYQVRQTPGGAAIAVTCRTGVDLADLSAEISTDLQTLGLPDPEVTITASERLDRLPATGKLKRFIPLDSWAGPPFAVGGLVAHPVHFSLTPH